MRIITALLINLLVFSSLALAQDGRQLTQEKGTVNSDKRIALVIGNAAYTKAKPLANPANDATDMAAALKLLGFEVISGTNQNKRQMETLIRDFGSKLASGGIGLFYYAGHGLQVNGENYLVPIDADIPQEDEVKYAAVPIGLVLDKMTSAKNDLNIVILDACRNNPFARSWRGYRDVGNNDGLAKISPPTGTFVLYATEPGKTASDGAGRNGLFTESLLKQIKKPSVEYYQMVRALSVDVYQKSKGQQLPWNEGNSLSEFYFNPIQAAVNPVTNTPIRNENAVVPKPTPLPTPTPVSVAKSFDAEGIYWSEISRRDTRSGYELYLAEYPTGKYAAEAKNRIDKFKQDELLHLKELERTKWREAQSLDSKNAYNAYITAYPNGEFVADARSNIKAIETNEERAKWLEDQKLNTKDSYQSYLSAYPNGEFAANARTGINALETKEDQAKWDEVQILNRKTAFKSYLSAYPNGKYETTAKQRIKEFDDAEALKQKEQEKAVEKGKWDDAERLKTVAGYKDYLAAYPKGEFASLARLSLRDLGVVLDALVVTPSITSPPVTTTTKVGNNSGTILAGTVRKNSIGMELVWIPPGEFMMGSTEAEVDEAVSQGNYTIQRNYYAQEMPKRKVTISEGFWMGRYEVTQGQWQAVMDDNPSGFKNCGANCPVERVTWDDIQVFLKRLNAKNDGFEYSLPREDEWEYAARAGTTTAFAFGDSLNSSQANFAGECPYASTKGINIGKTVMVGKYKPNAWGLYDMHGNVWELVLGDGYIRRRGGGYDNCASSSRSAVKSSAKQADRNKSIGFRVAAHLK